MIRPERFFKDRQSAFEQQFGLVVAALALVELRQIVEAFTDAEMVRAEGLLPDREGALGERLSFRKATLLGVDEGQIAERRGYAGILGPERLLENRRSLPKQCFGIRIAVQT